MLSQVAQPVIIHWLGDMFDPALAGYWGTADLDAAMETALGIIAANAAKVDGIKISLLDKDKEIAMRRRLAGVRMYTGDDFNYAELIAGDDARLTRDALLGIFDAIAPAASAALVALAAGDDASFHDDPRARPCRCRATSSRRRPASTRPAWCSWPISTATRIISRWSAASRARARRCIWPSCSVWPTRPACCAIRSWRRGACRPVLRRRAASRRRCATSRSDHRWLSLNTATVRKQARSRSTIIEACARHGIRAISPWRDQVAAVGLDAPSRAVRDAGLELSGYCRGGMFTGRRARGAARRATTTAAPSTRRRRSARPASCWWSAACRRFAAGQRGAQGHRGGARRRSTTASPRCWTMRGRRGMPLAIEPLHPMYAADRACVNTLEQALDLCDALDPARTGMLGVALDVYHVWWDPKLLAQIARAGRDRLLAFHVCDWLVPTTDLLNDRGMMGDGVDRHPAACAAGSRRRAIAGYSEVEIFSNDWWQRPMDEVLDTCIERHRSVV